MGRLEKLKVLEAQLAAALAEADVREVASIARQYRETLKEIEELEGAEAKDDDIAELLSARELEGKSSAVRKNRAKL